MSQHNLACIRKGHHQWNTKLVAMGKVRVTVLQCVHCPSYKVMTFDDGRDSTDRQEARKRAAKLVEAALAAGFPLDTISV